MSVAPEASRFAQVPPPGTKDARSRDPVAVPVPHQLDIGGASPSEARLPADQPDPIANHHRYISRRRTRRWGARIPEQRHQADRSHSRQSEAPARIQRSTVHDALPDRMRTSLPGGNHGHLSPSSPSASATRGPEPSLRTAVALWSDDRRTSATSRTDALIRRLNGPGVTSS